MHLRELKLRSMSELVLTAKDANVDNAAGMRRQDLVGAILARAAATEEGVTGDGTLECMPDGFGFLRAPDASYLPGPDDVYVSASQIRRFQLRTGDHVEGAIRPPKESERYFSLTRVDRINGDGPEAASAKIAFDDLTPIYPKSRLQLETAAERASNQAGSKDLSTRILDVVTPVGKGQRCLVVSPPRAGKTVLLQRVANAIAANHPEVRLMMLLVDERPEEVTDVVRSVKGEVVASTFDEPATRHVQVAEMALEKAKRFVEHKQDVVILLDSLTRLARAYNAVLPASGKVLPGGVDVSTLHKVKRFFGAARSCEEGGSLTIFATALVDTGSRMDEVVFEELDGTGNSEIHLDRRLMEKRVFPCVDIAKSATRKEELLMSDAQLRQLWLLRSQVQSVDVVDSMALLIEKLGRTATNRELLESMGP